MYDRYLNVGILIICLNNCKEKSHNNVRHFVDSIKNKKAKKHQQRCSRTSSLFSSASSSIILSNFYVTLPCNKHVLILLFSCGRTSRFMTIFEDILAHSSFGGVLCSFGGAICSFGGLDFYYESRTSQKLYSIC